MRSPMRPRSRRSGSCIRPPSLAEGHCWISRQCPRRPHGDAAPGRVRPLSLLPRRRLGKPSPRRRGRLHPHSPRYRWSCHRIATLRETLCG